MLEQNPDSLSERKPPMSGALSFLLIVLALSFLASTVTACNTVKGVGRDVESVGEAGSDAIDDLDDDD